MKVATRFAMQRIAALDRAVRAGEYRNASTLARLLEVDRRTVQRDIEFLRDRLGGPLEFDARRNGYRYADPDYRLSFLDLDESELIALFLAEGVLRQYRGTPYAADLASACRKIAAGTAGTAAGEAEAHSFRLTAPSPLDPGVYEALLAAIRSRSRLAIRYYSASRDEEADRRIDPYHVATIDGSPYLIAHCHARGEIRMFAPSRIRGLKATGETFDPPVDFRVEEDLDGSFAVLRGGPAHHVRLRFSGLAVRYVRERVWHPSQSVEDRPDGSLDLTLTVDHLREVERFALSWGPDCRVIEPEALRDLVARALALAAAQYGPPR